MSRILQEEFDGMVRRVYPAAPKEGSDQYEQLRDAFHAGALVATVHGEALMGPELQTFSHAKRMNIAFGDEGEATR